MSTRAAPGLDAGAWWGFRLAPTLVGSRVRMLGNGALRAGRGRRASSVVGALCCVSLMVLTYRLTASALADTPLPSSASLTRTSGTVLGTVAGFTLVTSITFALSALYFARDLDLLLVAPLPARSAILAKLTVQLATGVAIATVLCGPPLAALMAARGELGLLLPAGVAVAAMAAFPLCAGTAITVLAVRLLPARRVRDAGGLLVTVTVFLVTAGNLLVRGSGGFASAPAGLGGGASGGIGASLWLPPGWATRAVVAAIEGDPVRLLAWMLPLVLGAGLLLLGTAVGLETAFVRGFMRSLEAGRGGRHPRRSSRGRAGGIRAPWLALAAKDLRETRRDASQLGQLVLPIALFAFYIAAPSSSPALEGTGRLPAWYGVALTASFASLFAASGVGLRGVGSEGSRLWLLRCSPLRVRSLLAAKVAVGAGVAVSLGEGLLLVAALRGRLSLADLAAAAVHLAVVVAGLAGLAVGLGAVRPRLDWTDPRRAVGVGLSVGFLFLGSAYIGASFVLLALPYAAGAPSASALLLGAFGVCVLASVAAGVALAAGGARLRTLEL